MVLETLIFVDPEGETKKFTLSSTDGVIAIELIDGKYISTWRGDEYEVNGLVVGEKPYDLKRGRKMFAQLGARLPDYFGWDIQH